MKKVILSAIAFAFAIPILAQDATVTTETKRVGGCDVTITTKCPVTNPATTSKPVPPKVSTSIGRPVPVRPAPEPITVNVHVEMPAQPAPAPMPMQMMMPPQQTTSPETAALMGAVVALLGRQNTQAAVVPPPTVIQQNVDLNPLLELQKEQLAFAKQHDKNQHNLLNTIFNGATAIGEWANFGVGLANHGQLSTINSQLGQSNGLLMQMLAKPAQALNISQIASPSMSGVTSSITGSTSNSNPVVDNHPSTVANGGLGGAGGAGGNGGSGGISSSNSAGGAGGNANSTGGSSGPTNVDVKAITGPSTSNSSSNSDSKSSAVADPKVAVNTVTDISNKVDTKITDTNTNLNNNSNKVDDKVTVTPPPNSPPPPDKGGKGDDKGGQDHGSGDDKGGGDHSDSGKGGH